MSECLYCHQPDPVRLRHLLPQLALTTRRIPRTVWVRFYLRFAWERPNRRPLVSGVVDRYAAGPILVTVLPDGDPLARVKRARARAS